MATTLDDEPDWMATAEQDGPSPGVQNVPGRVILHLDLDCFYAQVETLRNPELKGKPMGK